MVWSCKENGQNKNTAMGIRIKLKERHPWDDPE